jgi:hypothetical protein
MRLPNSPPSSSRQLTCEQLRAIRSKATLRLHQRARLVTQDGQRVVGERLREIPSPDRHRLEIELASRDPDVDTLEARGVGYEGRGDGERLALGSV